MLRLNEYPAHIGFYCPACEMLHVFDERWKFDGNFEKPTFTPSLRTSSGHYVAGSQKRPDGKCGICENAKERGVQSICGVCHLNVTKGSIQFHADCTHGMAGQTVAMTVRPNTA
jgi:hypothetical protein